MQLPLFIELRHSRRLMFLLGVFHFVAAFSVCIALLPRATPSYRSLCLMLLLLIVWSAWRSMHRYMPERLRLAADGTLLLSFADVGGIPQTAKILSGSFASRQLVVLRLRIEDEACKYNLVLLPDQMPVEQFRQLIVCLRWLIKMDPMPA